MRLLNQLIQYLKNLFRSVEPLNVSKQTDIIITKEIAEEVKEEQWFTRKNDLIAEYHYIPTPVYSANFDAIDNFGNPLIVGYLQEDGSVTMNKEGALLKIDRKKVITDDTKWIPDKEGFIPKEVDEELIKKMKEQATIVEYTVGFDPYRKDDEAIGEVSIIKKEDKVD